MGWYTITSPRSSPRISTRWPERRSGRVRSVWAVMRRDYITSIHQESRTGHEHRSWFFVPFFVFRRLVGCAGVGDNRNVARFGIQFQHREHAKTFRVFELEAKNDEIGLDTPDLGVGVRARFDEHDVVLARIEYRLQHFEHIAAAVDDQNLLRCTRARGSSVFRYGRRRRRDHVSLHRLCLPPCRKRFTYRATGAWSSSGRAAP